MNARLTLRKRRRPRVPACIAATIITITGAVAELGPTAGAADARPVAAAPPFACPAPESYPPAGLPRSANPVPYEIPFSGTLNGGVLRVGSTIQAVVGPIDAKFCGRFSLPSETGQARADQIEITDNPIPVSVAVMGVQIIGAYAQVTGAVTASLDPVAAPSGGLNIDLSTTVDATLVPDVALLGQIGLQIPLDGAICSGKAGPIPATTRRSGKLQGQPITGPITGGRAVVVSNEFVFPAYQPTNQEANTTPPPPKGTCSPAVAAFFNQLLGLPNPPGVDSFSAPASFAIHVNP